ncbi:hypothetical protein CEXT_308701 [Caerostris extrusa]|uniref:Uncharacterized protein n=1 Tax=Caerostris extrusa TaxID=172846 RepID=A0AAV4PHJ9_CAEEX|nr:hypothetical protein CEXT_308701 [Caerostris extrusa]
MGHIHEDIEVESEMEVIIDGLLNLFLPSNNSSEAGFNFFRSLPKTKNSRSNNGSRWSKHEIDKRSRFNCCRFLKREVALAFSSGEQITLVIIASVTTKMERDGSTIAQVVSWSFLRKRK